MSYLTDLFKIDEERLKHLVRMVTDHIEKRMGEGEQDLKKIASELIEKKPEAPSAEAPAE